MLSNFMTVKISYKNTLHFPYLCSNINLDVRTALVVC